MYGIRFLSCGEFYSSVGWDTGERNVDSHILIHFPNASKTSYFERDSQWQLEKPCYVLSASRTLHRFVFDPSQSVRHQFFHFQGDNPLVSLTQTRQTPILAASGGFVPAQLQQILQIAYQQGYGWKARCNGLLQSVLMELEAALFDEEEKEQSIPPPLKAALHQMETTPERISSIGELAAQVGWSHEHFTRMTVKHLGITPQQLLLDRRIEKACQLLVLTNDSVKQVAYASGFKDEVHFGKVFKRMKGLTAGSFRKKYNFRSYPFKSASDEWEKRNPKNQVFFLE